MMRKKYRVHISIDTIGRNDTLSFAADGKVEIRRGLNEFLRGVK